MSPNSRRPTCAIIVLILLLSPLILSVTATSGRGPPDLEFVQTKILGDGIENATTIVLAPGEHTVRVTIENNGTSNSNGTLKAFEVDSGAVETEVDSAAVVLLPGEQATYELKWIVHPGLSWTLSLRLEQVGDADVSDNIQNIAYDGVELVNGELVDSSLPNGRHPPETASARVSVRNTGTIAVDVVVRITAWSGSVSGGSWTGPTTSLLPGEINAPASAQGIDVNIDLANLTGTILLNGTITLTSSGGDNVKLEIPSDVVDVSPYVAELIDPASTAISPGANTNLAFVILNKGLAADRWNIGLTSTQGWADPASMPLQTAILNAGETGTVQVPVTVPENASRANFDTLDLTLTSVNAGYVLQGRAYVLAGDVIIANTSAPTGLIPLTPPNSVDITYVVKNEGNIPATFDISAGLATVAIGWEVTPEMTATSILQPNENVSINVHVKPPELTRPMDPNSHLRENDQIEVWLQATPSTGGMPSTSQATLEVQAVLIADVEFDEDVLLVSKNEILADKIVRVATGSITLRHNIVRNIADTVDVTAAIGNKTFDAASNASSSEADRWTLQLQSLASTIGIDDEAEIEIAILGPLPTGVHGLPLAGDLAIPVELTVTPNGALTTISSQAIIRQLIVRIPEVERANLIDAAPLNLDPAYGGRLSISVENIGNHPSAYDLIASAPNGWSILLSRSQTGIISPPMASYPATNVNSQSFYADIMPLEGVIAGTVGMIDIEVRSIDTGSLLASHSYVTTVNRTIAAVLSPTDTVDARMQSGSTTSLLIKATNTGNAPSTFALRIASINSNSITINVSTPDGVLIAPNEERLLRLEISSAMYARSDEAYDALVELISPDSSDPLDVVSLAIEILETHDLTIDLPSEIIIAPGETTTTQVIVTNRGNTAENLRAVSDHNAAWSLGIGPTIFTIQPPGTDNLPVSVTLDLTFTVPPLNSTQILDSAERTNLLVNMMDENNEVAVNASTIVIVETPFVVTFVSTPPTLVDIRPGITKNISFEVRNDGILSSLEAKINATTLDPTRWNVTVPSEPIILPRTEIVSFIVQITPIAPDHYHQETTNLTLDIVPVSDEIRGRISLLRNLRIERMSFDGPIYVSPGEKPKIIVDWTHVPTLARLGDQVIPDHYFSAVQAARISASAQEAEEWIFHSIVVEGQTNDLGPQYVAVELMPIDRWGHGQIIIEMELPPAENMVVGDGYDLMLVISPDGEISHATKSVLQIRLEAEADAILREPKRGLEGLSLREGEAGIIVVEIFNSGTAGIPSTTAIATCDGVSLKGGRQIEVPPVPPLEYVEITWAIEKISMPWWATKQDFTCKVELDVQGVSSNVQANDMMEFKGSVVSRSVPMIAAIIATLAAVGLTIALTSMGKEEDREKLRLGAAFTGSSAFGFAFHIGILESGGWILLALTSIWILAIVWWSSEELLVIHQDHELARRGLNSSFVNHASELRRMRGSLTIILGLSICPFLLIAIGIPPIFILDPQNLTTLLFAIIGQALLIIGLLTLIDRLYGVTFGQIADVQSEAMMLADQLGEPATAVDKILHAEENVSPANREGGV